MRLQHKLAALTFLAAIAAGSQHGNAQGPGPINRSPGKKSSPPVGAPPVLRNAPTSAGLNQAGQNDARGKGHVVEASLKADRARTDGPCPATVHFHGSIRMDGPGVVRYRFVRSDGGTSEVSTLSFTEAGVKRVQSTWTLGDGHSLPRFSGWEAIRVLAPNELESSHETGSFSVTCADSARDRQFQSAGARPGAPGNGQPPPNSPTKPRPNVIADPGSVAAQSGGPRVRPVSPDNSPSPSGTPGRYRVVLNGFRVNHKTIDTAFDGDGRGDEIFVTSQAWVISSGSAGNQKLPRLQTKVMGDWVNHDDFVRAGTSPWGGPAACADPGPYPYPGPPCSGGLQTGDTFPDRNPAVRSHQIQNDRLPIVLWQGTLTPGENAVLIVPTIWEWDSNDTSSSLQKFFCPDASERCHGSEEEWLQTQVGNGHNGLAQLLPWLRRSGPAPADAGSAGVPQAAPAGGSSEAVAYPAGDAVHGGSRGTIVSTPPVIDFGIWVYHGRHEGTRPIGLREEHVPADGIALTYHPGDALQMKGIVLTRDIAERAVGIHNGYPGLFTIRYQDSDGEGDYTLFVQIERQ